MYIWVMVASIVSEEYRLNLLFIFCDIRPHVQYEYDDWL